MTPASDVTVETTFTAADKGNGKEVKKLRGIPEDMQLFEVFWHQIVELINARPDLALQDIAGMISSLCSLGLSCYPDRLEFVDQVFEFAAAKTKELAENSDLHSQQTTTNFGSFGQSFVARSARQTRSCQGSTVERTRRMRKPMLARRRR